MPIPAYTGSALLASLWGLFELHLAKKHWLIDQARSQAVRVTEYAPENEGQLVVVTGELTAADATVSDSNLNLDFSGLFLKRDVKMYQWSKSSYKQDDVHVESYSAGWSSCRLDDTFHTGRHKNPHWHPALSSKSWTNESRLTLGGFEIASYLMSSLNPMQVSLKEIEVKPLYEEQGLVSYVTSNSLYFSPKLKPNREYKAEVGDYQVKYSLVPDKQVVTVVGQQKATQIVPWRNSLLSIAAGSHTNESMLAREESGWGKWVVRGLLAAGLMTAVTSKV
jgi:hypothetical protein